MTFRLISIWRYHSFTIIFFYIIKKLELKVLTMLLIKFSNKIFNDNFFHFILSFASLFPFVNKDFTCSTCLLNIPTVEDTHHICLNASSLLNLNRAASCSFKSPILGFFLDYNTTFLLKRPLFKLNPTENPF